jgi:hypothetical protein
MTQSPFINGIRILIENGDEILAEDFKRNNILAALVRKSMKSFILTHNIRMMSKR